MPHSFLVKNSVVVLFLICGLIIPASASAQTDTPSRIESRSGVLEFDPSGYPTEATVDHIYDEMAYHGATQVYLWGTAILVHDIWRQGQLTVAGPLDWVTYNDVPQKYNIITSNVTTPYMIAFPNLKETGPLILEIPPGPTGGLIQDFQHRLVSDTGMAGPDKGEGGNTSSSTTLGKSRRITALITWSARKLSTFGPAHAFSRRSRKP